ncbi:MAG: FprA family A-type flavoprotein [Thermoanaerobaculaceae bacterium]|nr:FprA family A-type flavoprotein [Thermoanaerobaculaceae bacterium]MDI9621424.1 FprA family A-type flavoprotein [Acidobacteriota bacterium]NLH12323.1 FprA family A-type flavoprotein [Holophagae bacterium]HPW55473.1 FprA family A-type flavoprotein [Thermoanaerobaculaceae bacterium]
MKGQVIKDGVTWVGAIDWERRLFDELIPLPDGTTYNAYLVRGSDKTVLIDTVDPLFTEALTSHLEANGVTRVDYIVSNHAEQDHSGSLPMLLARFPEAKILTTPKGKGMLQDLLEIADERFQPVADGARVELGGRTLRFIHFPFVHWPETMVTYLEEDRILFSCDLFGSHYAVGNLMGTSFQAFEPETKRYYAEIMMPFRTLIAKSMPKVAALPLELIAPSHGPLITDPAAVLRVHADWLSDLPHNKAVLAFVSMHDSTRHMARYLAEALVDRGVDVEVFGLASADLGKLAMAMVDAATIVLGTPVVAAGAHPLVAYAASIANMLKPKARFAAIIGSQGWGGKPVEQLLGLIPNLKVEALPPVLARGLPRAGDFAALDQLADTIAAKHATLN